MDDFPAAVFDTGVCLQAIISKTGPAARALALAIEGAVILYMSDELLEEIEDVVSRPSIRAKNPHYTDTDIENLLAFLRERSILIPSVPRHFRYDRDPDDEHIINLAIESKASYLVARDKDLLDLAADSNFRTQYANLTILDPVSFLQKVAS